MNKTQINLEIVMKKNNFYKRFTIQVILSVIAVLLSASGNDFLKGVSGILMIGVVVILFSLIIQALSIKNTKNKF